MAYLVLVRHGESDWNKEGLWTGFINIDLDKKGIQQAKEAAAALKDIYFDIAFTSLLQRAQHTLSIMLEELGQTDIEIFQDSALNERDYGDLTGKNKWEIEKAYGEVQFLAWRRGWSDHVPHGENLEDVYNRVIPYYQKYILPQLESGKNVLVSAHGNSLRALVKYLDNLDIPGVEKLTIATGEVYIYQIDKNGKVIGKEIRGNKVNTV